MYSKTFISEVVKIIQKAGGAIMDVYQENDFGTEFKADGSPLTRADIAANNIIVAGLQALAPDIPVVSEESTASHNGRAQHERLWLVDPLDGTKEFIKRNGQFTVNIALVEHGVPVFGAVYAPALDLLYYGGPALDGSWKGEAGKPVHRLPPPAPHTPPVIVVSASHHSEEMDAYLQKIGEHERIAAGSSLKLCYVADGTADAYPRFVPSMEWDIAAGDAVVRGVGGTVNQIATGKPLVYNKKDLHNPFFQAIAS